FSARIRWILRELGKRGLWSLKHRDRAREVAAFLGVEAGHTGVRGTGRAEAALGLVPDVVVIDLVDLEHSQFDSTPIGEHHTVAPRRSVDRKADRKRPRQTRRQSHLLQYALVIVATHKAVKRRQGAACQHVQV